MQQPYVMPTNPGYPMPPPRPPPPAPYPAPSAGYPIAPPVPAPYPIGGGAGVIMGGNSWNVMGIPWWLWLLFLALLLLLLCILVFLACCCLVKRRNNKKQDNLTTVYHDESTSTNPIYTIGDHELKKQVISAPISPPSRQLDRHASIRLRNEHPSALRTTEVDHQINRQRHHSQPSYGAHGYDNGVFVGDVYEEDGIEKVVTEKRILYGKY